MKVRLFCFLLFLPALLQSRAQPAPLSDTARNIKVRHIKKEKLQKWQKSKHFSYETKQNPSSFWQTLKMRFLLWISDLFANKKSSRISRAVVIVIALIVVASGVYFLSGMQKSGVFVREANSNVGSHTFEEDIYEINFEEAVQSAEKSQDFRLALRYHYLNLLKNLSDKERINWQINKTNLDYIKEMKYDQVFIILTRHYEQAWYGELNYSQTEYEQIKIKFHQQMA